MLKYPVNVWQNFLNPTSNLNRFRLNDYQRIFDENFQQVKITVLERLLEEFHRVKEQVRPEFKTGDDAVDAVALMVVIASKSKMQ
jgi:hypothetical protein